jgi:hypothetical protein
MQVHVHHPDNRRVVYSIDANTRVFRWEPNDVPTPMAAHSSPYAPYGPYEFGYEHLFVVEEAALDELSRLRGAQGYFASNVVLRSATVGDLLASAGRGAVVVEDVKFNMTVLGGDRKGALIIAKPTR